MRKLLNIDLHLFDAGASTGASTTSSTVATGDAGQTGEQQTSQLANGKKGETIVYGKQPNQVDDTNTQANPSAQDTQQTQVDKKAQFESLIKGDFKDEFAARTQEIINNRFKDTKNLEKSLQSHDPIMQLLARRYGVDTNNVEAIQAAIMKDDALFEEEALANGMSTEQYKEFLKLKQENQRFQNLFEEQQRQNQAMETYNGWLQEAETLKAIYPDFDLNTEIANPSFLKLLEAGVDVKGAFNVVHMDDIVKGAVRQTATTVQQQVVNNIKSKASRPIENGSASQPGVIIKNDVTKLTARDRANIAERVRRGENIEF